MTALIILIQKCFLGAGVSRRAYDIADGPVRLMAFVEQEALVGAWKATWSQGSTALDPGAISVPGQVRVTMRFELLL